ncbi:hypothetical protein HYX04_03135 [Candidatus Woesearchaeota archaeon]|nr:hypothetical protein [Candidatus Woesearchaeota archaeon]
MNNKQKSNKDFSYKMIQNIKEFQINFWNLSDNVRLNLNKDFTIKLFDNCNIELKELAKLFDISYPFVIHLRKNMYSIPLDIILKLSNLSKISLEEIQNNITSIRTRAGTSMNIKFPIRHDEKIASLIGHVFGDGYIGRNKRQFEYSNNNPNLIKEVKTQISELFGILPYTEKQNRIGYPAITGEILEVFGAPIAPKIYSENLVPEWILKSKKYRIAFLKAFFDDDGSVMLSNNYRAKGLNMNVIRHINQKETLYNLLEQISFILKELDIYSGKPKISRQYKKEDGLHIVMYINITDYQSLINFYNKIGLTSGEKFEKLKKIVNSKIFYSKGNERILNNKILEFLSKKGCASTADIAADLGKSKTKALKKLKHLSNKGLVAIVGKVASNRSYLWKLNGGEITIEQA